jgi:HSP20 family protein
MALADRPIARLRDELDEVVDRVFGDFWGGSWPTTGWPSMGGGLGAFPRVDLEESEDEVIIKAEVPGVDAKELELNVVGDVLTIRGEKKEETQDKNRDQHIVERRFGSFSRSVQLPNSVDPDKVDATFKNGVLTVKLAKRPEVKPKRITVKSE